MNIFPLFKVQLIFTMHMTGFLSTFFVNPIRPLKRSQIKLDYNFLKAVTPL